MAIKTALTEMLNTEHPIMLAGMGGVSYAEVCAAMCNAGGYGVLGMAGTTPDFIEGQMKRVRELTDRPFGVDLLAASPASRAERLAGRRNPLELRRGVVACADRPTPLPTRIHHSGDCRGESSQCQWRLPEQERGHEVPGGHS